MKIWNVGAVNKLYDQQVTTKVTKTPKAAKTDQLNLSTQALDFQKASQAVRETGDIREDKIAQIKAQMASGTYNVGAKEVSEKIISQLDIKG